MRTFQKMHIAATALLLLVMTAFSGASWAQPVVTVPAACNVVVAGTGGSTGFGGTVGSGGVVVMPDPFAGGNFTVNPMGNTILSWGLAGDLSFTGGTPPTAPTQSAGGVTVTNIRSYNKFLRVPSESSPPSSPTLARSKGRVTIAYTNLTISCGGSIQFDVFKTYPNTGSGSGYVPPIIGPDCFEPGETYTYSVDQIASDNYGDGIGGDDYTWTIPVGLGPFYTSADKSSITFTVPSPLPAGPFVIQCCYGKANPWGAASTTCVSKTVVIQPTAPSFITPVPSCVSTAAGSFSASISPLAGHTYTWTASNTSWVLTPSGTQGQNLMVTSIGLDPGIITLEVDNGSCEPSEFTYNVNRQFAAPLAILGTACVNAGTVNNYQLNGGAQNTTCWIVPSGWTFVNANGSGSSINLTVPAGTAAGAYTISARSCACPAGVLNFTVNVRPGTPVISGASCVTRNGGPALAYTASGSTGATSYSWTYPTGWSCIANCATNTPVVQPGGTTTPPQNILVTAVGTNGCNTVSAPFVVNYSPIAPSTITASCWNFGVSGPTTITVANRPLPFYGTYIVTSSPAGLILSYSVNPTTGIITITTSGSAPAGSYTLNITHSTTGCGNSTTSTYPITYAGNGTIVTPVYSPGVGNSDVYITSNAPVGSTYQWYVNGSAVPGTSGGTASVLVLSGNGTPPTSVCVDVTSGGCITRVCATPGTHSLLPEAPESIQRMLESIEVFPNPNNGNFTLKVPAFEKTASVTIIDAQGRAIGTHALKAGDNRIAENDMITGSYFLIVTIDGYSSSKKIQVSQK